VDQVKQPLSKRKTWSQFKNLVTIALSSDMVSEKSIQASARRARSYILAYLFLHDSQNATEPTQQLFDDIETTAKRYRSHRGPSDQQSGFINTLYQSMFDDQGRLRNIDNVNGDNDESNAD
jgi:hypothetical protein